MASSRPRTTLALSVTLAVRLDLFFRRLCRWFHDGLGSGIVADIRTAPGHRVCAARHGTQEIAMAQRRLGLISLMLVACAALPACGTTGGTSRFALPLEVPQSPQGIDAVRVASAAMDENAAYLNAVNVRPWGKFGPHDLSNIEDSLRDTLAPHATAPISCRRITVGYSSGDSTVRGRCEQYRRRGAGVRGVGSHVCPGDADLRRAILCGGRRVLDRHHRPAQRRGPQSDCSPDRDHRAGSRLRSGGGRAAPNSVRQYHDLPGGGDVPPPSCAGVAR